MWISKLRVPRLLRCSRGRCCAEPQTYTRLVFFDLPSVGVFCCASSFRWSAFRSGSLYRSKMNTNGEQNKNDTRHLQRCVPTCQQLVKIVLTWTDGRPDNRPRPKWRNVPPPHFPPLKKISFTQRIALFVPTLWHLWRQQILASGRKYLTRVHHTSTQSIGWSARTTRTASPVKIQNSRGPLRRDLKSASS